MLKNIAAMALLLGCFVAPARASAPFQVDGDVGLSSLIALSDGRLQAMAATLEAVAATPEAQSAQWDAVKKPLSQASALGLKGLLVFATPDGSYWTVSGGKQSANVAHRGYFKTAMSGAISIGDLVVSQSTGKMQTVVAVPIRTASGSVAGVLAATIFLDDFSAQLKRELGIGPNVIFWAIDGTGKIAIHSDPTNIFVDPGKMSPALAKVRDEMLSHDGGTMSYFYRGAHRTVIYRKSSISDWRYGFGVVTGN